MKLIYFILACVFTATAASAQTEVVAAVKNDLVARHIALAGPCGAFEITKRVAWVLRAQGVGLLEKGGGNNCQGYSVDYLVFPDFSGRDILGDGGGENIPQWGGEPSEPPGTFVGRWRAPFDPMDSAAPGPGTGPLPAPVGETTEILRLANEIYKIQIEHEIAEAAERAKADAFRQAVGHEYQKFFVFVSKYILPAVGAIFVGMKVGN